MPEKAIQDFGERRNLMNNSSIIILYSILSIIGLIVAIWYIKSTLLNPDGRINYPSLLWKSSGHYVSWFLILLGVFAGYMLYMLIPAWIFIFSGIIITCISYLLIIKYLF